MDNSENEGMRFSFEENKFLSKRDRQKNAIILFVIILIALAVISGIALFWHTQPIENPQFALSLKDYDGIVTTRDVCFTLAFQQHHLEDRSEDLLVRVNDKIVLTDKIFLVSESEKELCLPNELFTETDNIIEAELFQRSIFFHVEKKESYEIIEPTLAIISFEKISSNEATINFEVTNSLQKNEPVEIYLNDKPIRRTFYPTGLQKEKVNLDEGENKLRIVFAGATEEIELFNEPPLTSNAVIGLLLIAFTLFILIGCVFSQKTLIENITYSLLTFFSILMSIFFILNYSGFLTNWSFVIALFVIDIILVLIFRNKFALPKFELRKPDHFEFFLGLFLLIVLCFNIVTPTNVSFWTSFYERQSQTIFEAQGVPLLDEFTHFGEKPYGYISGYFFVNVGISFLVGEQNTIAFAIIMVLANLALFLSAMMFFKKIGVSDSKAKLMVMLMLIGGFLLGDVFFNERHIIAVALMFLSLAMLVDKKKSAFIPAGIAMWLQLPIVLTFVLVSFVLSKEKYVRLIKQWIGAAIIGILFYIPTFLLYGLPTQAKPTTWGYLFGMPWYGVVVDLLAQIIFFFAIMLPIVLAKRKLNLKWDSYVTKILVCLALLIFVQLFISYRVNIATTIIFSFIAVYLFPTKILEKFEMKHLMLIIFIGGSLFASSVLLNYVVPDFAISSADHLALVTSFDDRIMNAPAMGHYTAYFSQRMIMADLAVEYADGAMLDDVFIFFEKEDPDLLAKYDIDYIYNRKFLIETQPVGSKERKEPIEFKFLDKIYDSSVFFIHKVR